MWIVVQELRVLGGTSPHHTPAPRLSLRTRHRCPEENWVPGHLPYGCRTWVSESPLCPQEDRPGPEAHGCSHGPPGLAHPLGSPEGVKAHAGRRGRKGGAVICHLLAVPAMPLAALEVSGQSTRGRRQRVPGQLMAWLLPSLLPRLDVPVRQGPGRLGLSAALEAVAGAGAMAGAWGLLDPHGPALSSARRVKEAATAGPGVWGVITGARWTGAAGGGAGPAGCPSTPPQHESGLISAAWEASECSDRPGSLSSGWEAWIDSLSRSSRRGRRLRKSHIRRSLSPRHAVLDRGAGGLSPATEAVGRSGWRPKRAARPGGQGSGPEPGYGDWRGSGRGMSVRTGGRIGTVRASGTHTSGDRPGQTHTGAAARAEASLLQRRMNPPSRDPIQN